MGIARWWKYSRIRFYIKNAVWNYGFWLNCKRQYEQVTYMRKNFFNADVELVTKRRFVGYMYKGNIYLDNPGRPIDRDEWEYLRSKGLI